MREPCMTLKELARLKGVKESALWNRSSRHPLPKRVEFTGFKPVSSPRGKSNQYRRSELLHWFDNSLAK